MNELIDKAIAKITDEMMKEQSNSAIVAIEEYLTSICTNESIANKLLKKGKTLQGALKEMENEARNLCSGRGSVCIGPQEANRIIESYYDIKPEDKTVNTSNITEPKATEKDEIIDIMSFM